MSTKGTIGVTTENIFPVIKQFLYSDHEIFLREIVANATDATQKMKSLAGAGEFKGELGDLTVRIEADKDKNIIRVIDRGIGMTSEEVERYINQIAFSSAGEFLEKYKDQSIIGHFGLGFYSAFMVSKKVVINSLSWKEGAKPVKWECEGEPQYKMGDGTRKERGTEIVLYLDDESKEFATREKVEELLKKYCRFMPVPIAFGKKQEWKDGKYVDKDEDNVINDTTPIWTRKPSDLKDDDYQKFYRDLFPMQEEPLFYIHLNVDYPFNLTGVLYFPKIKDRMEITRNKIQLYCNQVFVTDSVENIVPDFLTLLHGVIDSPDIPLNVSRSYLQADSNVKKISTYITKKVADRLEEIFKNDRSSYEAKWDNLKIFLEYGMLTDEKFHERAMKFALLKNTEGKYFTYDDYRKGVEAVQTDKNKKVVYLYTTDPVEQYAYVEAAKSKGYDVLVFDCQLDAHFINHLESKLKETTFARVDSDSIDKLIQKDEIKKPELSSSETEDLSSIFKGILPADVNWYVQAESLGENNLPLLITQSEFMRRYRDMSAMGGGMNFYGEMPASYNISVNMDHPLIKKVLKSRDESVGNKGAEFEKRRTELQSSLDAINAANKDKKQEEIPVADKDEKERLQKEIEAVADSRRNVMQEFAKGNVLLHQITDLALLATNMLKGKDLTEFIRRSTDVLK